MQKPTNEQKTVIWNDLLATALTDPGKLADCYRQFHNYSLGNQILAMMQCYSRNIPLGPLASFNRWKELGRNVKKGEKAIELCMPITRKGKRTSENGEKEKYTYAIFTFKRHWFVLAQTEGEDISPAPLPSWDKSAALETLNIKEVPFNLLEGNTQGFARPAEREISVSPIGQHPYGTMFHEIAHVLLHADKREEIPKWQREGEAEAVNLLVSHALGLSGAEESRGYIQHWMTNHQFDEKMAKRIFQTADKILKPAGRQTVIATKCS